MRPDVGRTPVLTAEIEQVLPARIARAYKLMEIGQTDVG